MIWSWFVGEALVELRSGPTTVAIMEELDLDGE